MKTVAKEVSPKALKHNLFMNWIWNLSYLKFYLISSGSKRSLADFWSVAYIIL